MLTITQADKNICESIEKACHLKEIKDVINPLQLFIEKRQVFNQDNQ